MIFTSTGLKKVVVWKLYTPAPVSRARAIVRGAVRALAVLTEGR